MSDDTMTTSSTGWRSINSTASIAIAMSVALGPAKVLGRKRIAWSRQISANSTAFCTLP